MIYLEMDMYYIVFIVIEPSVIPGHFSDANLGTGDGVSLEQVDRLGR
jgi:hypothetical protein